jgi:hypothetical protein
VHPPKLSCPAGLAVDQERGHGACTHTARVRLHLAAPGELYCYMRKKKKAFSNTNGRKMIGRSLATQTRDGFLSQMGKRRRRTWKLRRAHGVPHGSRRRRSPHPTPLAPSRAIGQKRNRKLILSELSATKSTLDSSGGSWNDSHWWRPAPSASRELNPRSSRHLRGWPMSWCEPGIHGHSQSPGARPQRLRRLGRWAR